MGSLSADIALGSDPSARPANLLTIFQAHFHVRRGNEITYQHGHDLDLSGVEWKTLPSGSHALHRDLIWFTPPGHTDVGSGGDENRFHKVGVAVFRNRQLTTQDEDEDGDDGEDQRGARMIAVGIVVAADSLVPSSHLAACLPHIEALQLLAEDSAQRPRDQTLLSEFLHKHRFDPSKDTHAVLQQIESTRCPAPLSRKPIGQADPLLDLPSIANALGLVLPQLIRKLLIKGTRLLVFSPLGAETGSAASIGWNLAEILEGALSSQHEAAGDDEDGGASLKTKSSQSRFSRHQLRRIPRVRGILALPDLGELQEEQRERARMVETGSSLPRGWISWTADKLFLEKADLYDCLLDLSPLFAHASTSVNAHASSLLSISETTPATSPTFSLVERSLARDGKRTLAALKPVYWHPRDFAIYRSNELRSVKLASRPRSLARRGSRSSVRALSSDDGEVNGRSRSASLQTQHQHSSASNQLSWPRSPSRGKVSGKLMLSHMIAFLRYWLSSLWFIPEQWRINLRESYGYVPLSIRPDGGVQAGLMILPDSDSESDAGEEEDEDEEDGGHISSPGKIAGPSSKSNEMRRQRARTSSSNASSTARTQRHYLSVPKQGSDAANGTADDSDDDGDGDEVVGSPGHSNIDPLLAACGAHSPAASRRLSKSGRDSSEGAEMTTGELVAGNDREGEDDLPSHGDDTRKCSETRPLLLRTPSATSGAPSTHKGSPRSPRGATAAGRRSGKSVQASHRDSRLARAIFTIWTEWLRELVLDFEAIAVGEDVDEAQAVHDDEQASDAGSSTPLPPLTSRQLTALGLNSRNEEDRALVRDMTGREVLIGFWKFWGNWI